MDLVERDSRFENRFDVVEGAIAAHEQFDNQHILDAQDRDFASTRRCAAHAPAPRSERRLEAIDASRSEDGATSSSRSRISFAMRAKCARSAALAPSSSGCDIAGQGNSWFRVTRARQRAGSALRSANRKSA
jgi:hypothetical protein